MELGLLSPLEERQRRTRTFSPLEERQRRDIYRPRAKP
jgi:hypothetical protein